MATVGSLAANPRPATRARLPGLDGMRAIAVGWVILYHAKRPSHFVIPVSIVSSLVDRGAFGVDIFFVLSGFLITTLLLDEEKRRGSFSLRLFYLRRAARILPPIVFYLTCVSLLAAAGAVKFDYWDLIPCTFFFRNLAGSSRVTGQFWSLAVEEQFYLLWPATLFVILSPRRRLGLAVLLIFLAPFWREANYFAFGGPDHVKPFRFDLVYDALMVGCALALLRSDPELGDWLMSVLSPRQPALWIAGFMMAAAVWMTSGVAFMYKPLCYLATAAIINHVLDRPDGALGRLLQSPILIQLGLVSYSLYIWQQLVTLHWDASAHPWSTAPIAFAILFGIASFSYYVIERPFIALRARLH